MLAPRVLEILACIALAAGVINAGLSTIPLLQFVAVLAFVILVPFCVVSQWWFWRSDRTRIGPTRRALARVGLALPLLSIACFFVMIALFVPPGGFSAHMNAFRAWVLSNLLVCVLGVVLVQAGTGKSRPLSSGLSTLVLTFWLMLIAVA
jgi:hypothetical protein